jgi:hypothetical protein
MQNHRIFLILVLFLIVVSACTNQNVRYAPSANPSATINADLTGTQVSTIAFTPTISPTPGPSPTSTPDLRLLPDQWREWPVIPVISAHAIELYRAGLARGNNPKAFSKIGDCQSISQVMMGIYDIPERYSLSEEDAYLQETIDNFAGSFNRDGYGVKGGFNAAAVLDPMWADPSACQPGETPIECEFRINNPSIVVISLEVWWEGRTVDRYITNMRSIIEEALIRGILPILVTKADNVEGDNSINLATAQLAYEYDIPLWNFWLAVQSLPNQGLDPVRNDGFHISSEAWNVRSYTGLQALDAVWRAGRLNDEVIEITPSATNEVASASTLTPLQPDKVNGGVYFTVEKRLDSQTIPQGVYQLDIDTHTLNTIAGEGFRLQAVSKDGSEILLNNDNFLYLLKADGSTPFLMSQNLYAFGQQTAAWTADEKGIVFIVEQNDGRFLMYDSMDGTDPKRLTTGDLSPIEVYASSLDDTVYFGNGDCSSFQVCQRVSTYSVQLTGGGLLVMEGVINPEMAPGGVDFAYSVPNADVETLSIATFDRTLDRPILALGTEDLKYFYSDYKWSPDGTVLSVLASQWTQYSGKVSVVRNLLVTPVDWGVSWLPDEKGMEPHTTWSPDGGSLLYGSTLVDANDNYFIHFSIYNLTEKSTETLDDTINPSADFQYISSIFWVSGK